MGYLCHVTVMLALGFSATTFAADGSSRPISRASLVKCMYVDGEVVVQNPSVYREAPATPCGTNIQAIDAAKKILKQYWTSSRKEQYALLSTRYKKLLKQVHKIDNAQDYSQSFADRERVWAKQTYQRATAYADRLVEFVVLGYWLEEGYEGVATFNFDLINEGGVWRIDYIMY